MGVMTDTQEEPVAGANDSTHIDDIQCLDDLLSSIANDISIARQMLAEMVGK